MKTDQAEEEALVFANYSANHNNYYVQSPSSVSQYANSSTELGRNHELVLFRGYHSPLKELHDDNHRLDQDVSRSSVTFNLSRCSSSRASVDSFSEEKNMEPAVIHHHVSPAIAIALAPKKLGNYEDGDEEDYYDDGPCNNNDGSGGCWRYLSFNTYSSSFVWIALQLLWRFLLSLMAALLVFYIATKPPSPRLSLQVAEVRQFELTEGVDSSGVATNFLSCNISMGVVIDNKSKVFGLHILSPQVQIYFGQVPFVASHGPKLYAVSHHSTGFKVYAGVTTKPMYGGGRSMEDMLNSGKGLPLFITLSFTSYYRVVGNLVQPTFHHRAHCLVAIQNFYDKQHRTQAYNSTCLVTSS